MSYTPTIWQDGDIDNCAYIDSQKLQLFTKEVLGNGLVIGVVVHGINNTGKKYDRQFIPVGVM